MSHKPKVRLTSGPEPDPVYAWERKIQSWIDRGGPVGGKPPPRNWLTATADPRCARCGRAARVCGPIRPLTVWRIPACARCQDRVLACLHALQPPDPPQTPDPPQPEETAP